ncbi:thioesterase family protein [Nocardioides insulae]|uniref:thioesterase family protein n=1 Tax=Nocardioides insulae TaxID=394734 RepID=UPI00042A679A|nr:thioesterase family protein [Nocardioides insulae]
MSGNAQAPAAFYLPVGDDEFDSTVATSSPWDDTAQHGGPPSALLARAAERCRPDDGMQLSRITVDMLGAIPQGRIRTEAEVVRPGRRIELIHARLFADDRLAATALVWRIRSAEGSTADLADVATPPALPPEQPQRSTPGLGRSWGYANAVEWRFVTGGADVLGATSAWGRPRIPLVAGETTSPVERMLVLADSVNGLSIRLPVDEWLSIPPTLTVTILRPPAGEWLFLDTRTLLGPAGTGLARGHLFDAVGPVADVAQPLLVDRR